MGIWDKAKAAAKGMMHRLGFGKGEDLPPKQEKMNPTVGLRPKYLWVSKEIPEEVRLALELRLPKWVRAIMRRAKGRTLNAGVNQLKRDCDLVGQNNKARRRNRSAMRAQMKSQLDMAVAQ